MGERGRRGSGVDKRAGAVRDEIDPIPRRREVSAGEADRLAERAHLERDFSLESEFLRKTHTLRAEDPGGVGLI